MSIDETTRMMTKETDVFPPAGSGIIRRNWRFGLRVVFGLFWTADAVLKWMLLAQGIDYAKVIANGAEGQPSLIASWISYWAGIAAATPGFSVVVAFEETMVAIFLLLGLLTKITSLFGIVFNFLIWSTAEAFGGIFVPGATDIGASPLYMAMFAGLIIVQAGKQHGLDDWLSRRFPRISALF